MRIGGKTVAERNRLINTVSHLVGNRLTKSVELIVKVYYTDWNVRQPGKKLQLTRKRQHMECYRQ